MSAPRVHIDFEACSELDLKKVGTWEWTKHTSTQAICAAFATPTSTVLSWAFNQRPNELALFEWLKNPDCEIHAWNAQFEHAFWNNVMVPKYGWPAQPLERFHCTMATAANAGLPMSLDQAAPAAGAAHLKDKQGHALMLRMARPRLVKPLTWWHDTDPQKLQDLRAYNIKDVEAERDIASRIPRMSDQERKIWLMDQRMNIRGLRVDTPLVNALQKITDDEMFRLSQELSGVTSGEVSSVTQVAKLTSWLQRNGLATVDSLAKDALKELLARKDLPDLVRSALKIRQEAAKSSTAKLDTMFNSSQSDGRIRYLVQYYGANRTGRWAGRGAQIQNYPRPTVKLIDVAIKHIRDGVDPETLAFMFGPALEVVSTALRGCFVATPGKKLVVCDFSQIEARVVCWLAGQQDILDVFASGEDVYVFTAARIGSDNRQLGKVAVLGLGYGMGPDKFIEAALIYGIVLDPLEAEKVVRAWRAANAKIVSFWYNCDRAARRVIDAPSVKVRVGPCLFSMGTGLLDGAMLITLPSGRQLVYRNARIEIHGGRDSITFDGLDQYTRKWGPIRTYGGKLVENITQAVARDLMAEAMLEMEAKGLDLLATIHDEAVGETDEALAPAAYRAMKQIMSTPPAWAAGLPLGGDGFISERYGK